MELLLLLAGGLLTLSLLGGRPGSRARAVEHGARRVRTEMDAVYGGEHRYQRCEPGQFPEADLAPYQAGERELHALGFRTIADVEDLTLSEVYPAMRTFTRVLVDDAGLIRAGIYHLRPRGMMLGMLQLVRMVPRELRVIALVTEVPRGRFVVTANTAGLDLLDHGPAVALERVSQATPAVRLVERHRARLTELVRKRADASPVAVTRYEDVITSLQRGNVVAAMHRKGLRGLSRDELERMKGRPLEPGDEEFLRAIQDHGGAAKGG